VVADRRPLVPAAMRQAPERTEPGNWLVGVLAAIDVTGNASGAGATLRQRGARVLRRIVTGQVVTRRAKTMGRATLAPFFPERRAAYPEAERIDVILDNWPVHGHPDVLVALEPQTTRWAFSRPGNWPATPSVRAVRRAGDVRRPIQLMPLPTYASWCNPIEKLWRWMRQEVTRLHRWATDLDQLRNHLDARAGGLCPG
jgi:transposase